MTGTLAKFGMPNIGIVKYPIDSITGTTTICAGQTTTPSDASPGGTWSSGSPGVGTISITGIVTGISPGTTLITYSIGGACAVTITVTVKAAPTIISGPTELCTSHTAIYTDSPVGGTWTSSDTTVATINATTGFATGLSAGTTSIDYTLSTGCYSSLTLTVGTLSTPITGILSVRRTNNHTCRWNRRRNMEL